ncbi:MAG TPA: hypothetical protein VE135_24185 [Pyrinomonadaceae bacterium]|nr:hypothetical protein [Pyrinomonadaceae bacterium]
MLIDPPKISIPGSLWFGLDSYVPGSKVGDRSITAPGAAGDGLVAHGRIELCCGSDINLFGKLDLDASNAAVRTGKARLVGL